MRSPAIYLISILLFIGSGLLLFAAGSSWVKLTRHRENALDEWMSRRHFRAAAGLTAAAFTLLGAAVLWAAVLAFVIEV